MSEKAKLKYDGLSYYDEDLEKICKIFCTENKVKYQGYTVDRILNAVLIWYGNTNDKAMFQLPFDLLKNYRVSLKNEKPVIDWPSSWGHFIYYRKDIWGIADLVTAMNGLPFKSYKLDNRGKFLYIYFYHPICEKCFIGVGYKDIETLKYWLKQKDPKAIRMKARAWGENLGF